MKKQIVTSLLLTSILSINSFASTNYSTMAFNDSVYSYADDINLPNDVFSPTQIRLNKAIYSQSALIFSKEHVNQCYGTVNTGIFESFKDNIDPIIPMAFSVVEWGGNGNLKYTFTPAIATSDLEAAGVPIDYINPLEVNSNYYLAVGAKVWDTRRYYGPLQINNSYFNPTASYRCGYVPSDYYCWPDEVQWTFHNKCESIKSTWNSDWTFKSTEELIAVLAVAHNSGGAFLSSKGYTSSVDYYPWKSSQAVFDYCRALTSEHNLDVIEESASSYANELLNKYKSGTESGALYFSMSDALRLINNMDISVYSYIRPEFNGNLVSRAKEKTMYPVQVIWSYKVLKLLYGL